MLYSSGTGAGIPSICQGYPLEIFVLAIPQVLACVIVYILNPQCIVYATAPNVEFTIWINVTQYECVNVGVSCAMYKYLSYKVI